MAYKKSLKQAAVFFSGLLIWALNVSAQTINCVSYKTSTTGWVSSIQITNNCSQALDFQNAQLTFQSDAKGVPQADPWGTFPSGMSYLQFTKQDSGFVFKLDPANKLWQKTKLPVGESLTLNYSANSAATNPVLTLDQNPTPPPINEKGSIEVSFAIVSVDGMTSPILTLTGPSYPSGKTFTYEWSQPILKLTDLAYGQYTITASNVQGRTDEIYVPTVTPGTVNIQTNSPKGVQVGYKLAPVGSVAISLGQAPVAGIPSPQIVVKNAATNETVKNLPTFSWGATTTISQLPAGNSYIITANQISYNNVTYKATVNPAQVTVTENGSAPVSIQYQTDAPPVVKTGTVVVSVSGSPMSGTTSVVFSNTQDNSTNTQSVNLKQTTNLQLPIGSYTVSANGFDYSGQTYYAQKYEPSTVVVSENQNTALNITYAVRVKSTALYAPYIDVAGIGNPAYKFSKLSDLITQANVKNVTLAFVLASGSTCKAEFFGDWNGSLLNQINDYRAKGGYVIASFGGANGPYVEDNCTSASDTQKAYQSIVDKYGIKYLDFDVEGHYAANTTQTLMRAKAIAGLQNANSEVKISFTLAVMPTGLTVDAINMIKQAKDNGVNIDRINIMAMDYGWGADPNKMGQAAMDAANSTFNQLKAIYTQKSDAQLWAMIGITPMIGVNDVQPEVFTLVDAQQVVDFAKQKGIPYIGSWSIGRDQACPTPTQWASSYCSGISQQPYDFAKIFNQLNS